MKPAKWLQEGTGAFRYHFRSIEWSIESPPRDPRSPATDKKKSKKKVGLSSPPSIFFHREQPPLIWFLIVIPSYFHEILLEPSRTGRYIDYTRAIIIRDVSQRHDYWILELMHFAKSAGRKECTSIRSFHPFTSRNCISLVITIKGTIRSVLRRFIIAPGFPVETDFLSFSRPWQRIDLIKRCRITAVTAAAAAVSRPRYY